MDKRGNLGSQSGGELVNVVSIFLLDFVEAADEELHGECRGVAHLLCTAVDVRASVQGKVPQGPGDVVVGSMENVANNRESIDLFSDNVGGGGHASVSHDEALSVLEREARVALRGNLGVANVLAGLGSFFMSFADDGEGREATSPAQCWRDRG